jgi:hypothetical protein
MTDLEARRAALLLESELNRQALRLEAARVQVSLQRLRAGVFSGPNLWKWVAPVAGFVLARKFGSSGTAATGTALFSMGRALWNAWKDRRRARGHGTTRP